MREGLGAALLVGCPGPLSMRRGDLNWPDGMKRSAIERSRGKGCLEAASLCKALTQA